MVHLFCYFIVFIMFCLIVGEYSFCLFYQYTPKIHFWYYVWVEHASQPIRDTDRDIFIAG